MRKESYFVLRFTTPDISKWRKGQPVTISNDYITKVYKNLLDWLCNNGYQFNPSVHKGVYMKVYTPSEVRKMTNLKEMYRMPNGNYFAIDRDVRNCSKFIVRMLTAAGCSNITLKDTVLERNWI